MKPAEPTVTASVPVQKGGAAIVNCVAVGCPGMHGP